MTTVQELTLLHRRYADVSHRFRSGWTFHQFIQSLGKTLLQRVEDRHSTEFQELYTGLKEVSQSLNASEGERVRGRIEAIDHRLTDLIAALDAEVRAKVQVVAGPAAANAAIATGADVVIADPPRKGLDQELKAQLLAHPPQRFIYVSCGLASFLSDTAQLTAAGTLRLADLSAFNLMPYTEHVETVACFERA